jgi:hypothetical protein
MWLIALLKQCWADKDMQTAEKFRLKIPLFYRLSMFKILGTNLRKQKGTALLTLLLTAWSRVLIEKLTGL